MSEHCPECGSRLCGHGACPECNPCPHCDGGDRGDKFFGYEDEYFENYPNEGDWRRAEKALDHTVKHTNVSYIPEEIRQLPNEYRRRADNCRISAKHDRNNGYQQNACAKSHRADIYENFAKRLEHAIAATYPNTEEPCPVCGEMIEDLSWCGGPFEWCPSRE